MNREKTENIPARGQQRLERTVAADGFNRSPEEKRAILKQRAAALARVRESENPDEVIEAVTFQLAHEHYALESRYIVEVVPLTTLTPIPCTPSFVLGVVNLRGLIISVIDLKIFFELPIQGITNLNRLIILEAKDMAFGILADLVTGATNIPLRSIQPPLPTLTDVRVRYLRGVTRERLIVLDGLKLLSDSKMVIRDEVGV